MHLQASMLLDLLFVSLSGNCFHMFKHMTVGAYPSGSIWICILGRKYDSESESRSVVSDSLRPTDYTVHGIFQARILEWVALFLLYAIFPTQGSNPGLPCCRRILYQLSPEGNPRILEWVAYPFSGSSGPRN